MYLSWSAAAHYVCKKKYVLCRKAYWVIYDLNMQIPILKEMFAKFKVAR